MPIQPNVAIDETFVADFTDVTDLHGAMERVREATDRFNLLPAEVRAKFGNDPAHMYQFLTDPNNIEAAAKMGFTIKNPNEKAPEAPTTDDKSPVT